MAFHHISVLLHESIELLRVDPEGIYVDGTLGGGGHAALICGMLGETGTLVGIDRDRAALCAAEERLTPFLCQKHLCHQNFFQVKTVLRDLQIAEIDGAILDLGVSSPQLDEGERGFSYRQEARLDMRMNREAALDA